MDLPLYRINDQVIFEHPIGESFSVGLVRSVNLDDDTWKYKIEFNNLEGSKLSTQKDEIHIRGVLFESRERMECNERTTAEEAINLDFEE